MAQFFRLKMLKYSDSEVKIRLQIWIWILFLLQKSRIRIRIFRIRRKRFESESEYSLQHWHDGAHPEKFIGQCCQKLHARLHTQDRGLSMISMDWGELNYNNQTREQPGQHSDLPRNFSLHDLLPALTVWACTWCMAHSLAILYLHQQPSLYLSGNNLPR